jgi:excisionase family DNA binding protein
MAEAESTPTRYSIRAAAERLGVSPKTIRKAITEGKLEATKALGVYGEEYLVGEEALDAWHAGKGVKASGEGVFTSRSKSRGKGLAVGIPGGDFAALLESYRAQVEALSSEVANLRERAGRAEEKVALLGAGKGRGLLSRLFGGE